MHDWDDVASDGMLLFSVERKKPPRQVRVSQAADESKDCQMKRAPGDHNARASNQGHRP
jgi:hypothetical protein